jgi:hypothetical protein
VDDQVQPAGGCVAEQAAEFVGPLLAAGRDHDAGAGGEVGAHRAFADPAGAAGDQDVPAGKVRRKGAAGHELAPRIVRAAASCVTAILMLDCQRWDSQR